MDRVSTKKNRTIFIDVWLLKIQSNKRKPEETHHERGDTFLFITVPSRCIISFSGIFVHSRFSQLNYLPTDPLCVCAWTLRAVVSRRNRIEFTESTSNTLHDVTVRWEKTPTVQLPQLYSLRHVKLKKQNKIKRPNRIKVY